MRSPGLLCGCLLLCATGCPRAGEAEATGESSTTSSSSETGSSETGSSETGTPTTSTGTTDPDPGTSTGTSADTTDPGTGAAPTTGAPTECVPDSVEPCYDGPPGTLDVGACHAGTRVCSPDGAGFGPCTDQVLPSAARCEPALDQDCDGTLDGAACSCAPGESVDCYAGPPGTAGVGVCVPGKRTCDGDGTLGPCVGATVPQAEQCSTYLDDDCDGQVNEADAGCVCPPLSMQGCYTGTPDTDGIGTCKAGNQLCNAAGTAYGPCEGEVVPEVEICGSFADEDCDDQIDEDCAAPPWTPDAWIAGRPLP